MGFVDVGHNGRELLDFEKTAELQQIDRIKFKGLGRKVLLVPAMIEKFRHRVFKNKHSLYGCR